MNRAIDALHEDMGPEDPWLALLLGCIAWSRSLGRGVGAGDPAPSDTPEPGAPRRAEPALLALLGMVAVDRRLRAQLGEIDDAVVAPPPRPALTRRGLLR